MTAFEGQESWKGDTVMKSRFLAVASLAAALSAFSIGAAAQHAHSFAQARTSQEQSGPGMMGGGMMGQGQGRMGQGMMGQMMSHHQQMSELMNKLMQSMSAMQNQKNSSALNKQMAEHKALLDQMRSQMMQQGRMLQNFAGQVQKSCPALNGDTTK
jgi:hypothetical protein